MSTSRTLMLPELRLLLAAVPETDPEAAYRTAVIDDNVTHKPTLDARERTLKFLMQRFGLNPVRILLFRVLRELWPESESGQSLLAMLLAMARDPILRATADAVVGLSPGEQLTPAVLAHTIEHAFPDRLGEKTLRSTAQNVAAAWMQAGLLHGKLVKIRQRVEPTNASITYSLFLAYLTGARGQGLFTSPWLSILDTDEPTARQFATDAARQGWLELRSAGGVTEVSFHHFLNQPRDER